MTLLPWIVVGLLTGLNAVYVASEFAVVAMQPAVLSALVRTGRRGALPLLQLLKDGVALDRYVAACQIGITFSSLLAGAYAQATIATELASSFEQRFGMESIPATSFAAGCVLLTLTALQVVLAELVPKSLALQFPERTAIATRVPMRWSLWLYRGFIALMNGSAFLLLKPFAVTPGSHHHVHSPDELAWLFAESSRGGQLSSELHQQLQRALRLSRRTVRELMTPRGRLDTLEVTTPPDEILRRVSHSQYSRLPVYSGTLDNLLGTVGTKAIVAGYVANGEVPPLTRLITPIAFVPQNVTADRLIGLLRAQRTSKAIVVDEFGGVQGMITINDFLGELFGAFEGERRSDPHEDERDDELLPDGRVKLRGSTRRHDAEKWLGEVWPGSAATLAGLIESELGRIPAPGERVEIGGHEFTVLEVSPTGIAWVALRPKRNPAAEAQPE